MDESKEIAVFGAISINAPIRRYVEALEDIECEAGRGRERCQCSRRPNRSSRELWCVSRLPDPALLARRRSSWLCPNSLEVELRFRRQRDDANEFPPFRAQRVQFVFGHRVRNDSLLPPLFLVHVHHHTAQGFEAPEAAAAVALKRSAAE